MQRAMGTWNEKQVRDTAIRFRQIRISREGSTTLQSLATYARAENRRLFERATGTTLAGRSVSRV